MAKATLVRPELARAALRYAAPILLGLAAALRVNNALRYKTRLGFDAVENVAYIRHLTVSWALPAPDAAWATSHPPLFYYLSGALGRALSALSREDWLLQAIPLFASACGLGVALLAALLVRRVDPGDPRRALIAMALLLFMPVHVYMSAMVNEELLAALLVSLVLVAALPRTQSGATARHPLLAAAGLGALAGLALLTKLSGCLVALALAAAWLIDGLRTGEARSAARRVAALLLGLTLVGGWFYARNLTQYGYLYPQDLAPHALMFQMPPGERELLDYLRIPLATFSDPQLLNEDLLRSVWGSTYATIFFDGHRHFLASSVAASRAGTALLLLALLPTAAFLGGTLRGLRRALHEAGGPDTVLLLLLAISLAGYVVFTWANPWFATLKGSYLLGLSLPFAFYASETLADWTRLPGALGWAAWGMLAALLVLVLITFTIGPVFTKPDGPGLPWRSFQPAA